MDDEEEQTWNQFFALNILSNAAAAADEDTDDPPSQPLSSEEPILLGFVIANIVGLRYYSGRISGRELVGLVREPLNPFDPNAIKVLNTRTEQLGHIDRSIAAALAPLIDSRLVTLECIVPKPHNKNQNPYRLPCQIHIFALLEAIPTVSASLLAAGLHLIFPSDHEFPLSESAIIQETNHKNKKKTGNGNGKTIDEIFALVKENGNAAPAMEPNREIISADLFRHQKEGLGWLVSRENSADLPPFWEKRGGSSFVNLLTNYETSERPAPIRGGIFADDMGLGKTLTLLSLIASNRTDVSGSSSLRACGGSKSSRSKKQKVESLGPKTTLVVCPSSVLVTWITQLEQHTKRDSLKVYLYHGERTSECSELTKHDIVLTTYKILASEFGAANSPLKEIEWLRVIIDEAHVIKNFAAQQTKAVIALKAQRRWVVTGTPIQNSSFDLFSLMAFLQFQPFSIKSYWQSLVQRPLAQGSKHGISRIQVLGLPQTLQYLKLQF